MSFTVLLGNALDLLKTQERQSVQCCVTSPPYWGLRDYNIKPQVWGGDSAHVHIWLTEQIRGGPASKRGQSSQMKGRTSYDDGVNVQRGQSQGRSCECGAWRGSLGLEPTPELYVQHIVEVFREVKRVLRKDGTLWINLGDCYSSSGGCTSGATSDHAVGRAWNGAKSKTGPGLKPKDLVGLPWRVAFALQADGWWLRSDIVWSKPNSMPESVTDRPTKAHEYIFLLSKSAKYFYDADAIREPATYSGPNSPESIKSPYGQGFTRAAHNNARSLRSSEEFRGKLTRNREPETYGLSRGLVNRTCTHPNGRNKRSVWTISTLPTPETHFATYPIDLIEPCILAGSRPDDLVLDPFCGAGTTGMAALKHGRRFLGLELNPEYVEITRTRLLKKMPLLAQEFVNPAEAVKL